ncbi:hypothetical protein DV738_g5163, partial [Chaetothyriales sp. CBS 135597]
MAQSVNKTKENHITFIVGDARSKQNISRIRSHASRAPKFDPKAPPADNRSSRSHSQASSSTSPPSRLSQPGRPDEACNAAILPWAPPTHRDWPFASPGSTYQLPVREIRLCRDVSDGGQPDSDPSFFEIDDQGKRKSRGLLTPDPDSLLPLTTSSSPASATKKHSVMQVGAILDRDAGTPKRARHQAHRASTFPPWSDDGGREQAHHRLQRAGAPLRLPSVFDVVSHAPERRAQRDRKARSSLHPRTRLIASPSRPLILSPAERNFEQVLLRTTAFYTSRFDNKWGPMISQNKAALDLDGRAGSLYEAFLTTAALIEAGRPRFADMIIQRTLGVMEDLFLTEHPALYNILTVIALDPSPSVLGQIHRLFTRAIIPIARRTLGNEHPYTQLLTSQFSPEMTSSLREAVQLLLHELSITTFGDSHHQTCESFFICGRGFAHVGLIDEALDVLEWIKERWEGQHGMNSMLAVWVLLDQAGLYLAAGIADVRTEMILSDARRRLKILLANTSQLADGERQRRREGITNLDVGALRAFGKLHIIRRNFGAALESYRQAEALAREVFGVDSPATQLAQGDLDHAYESRLSAWQTDYSPGKEEEKLETVPIILGDVARSRVPFGREPAKVVNDKVPVYGVVPYEDLVWREVRRVHGKYDDDKWIDKIRKSSLTMATETITTISPSTNTPILTRHGLSPSALLAVGTTATAAFKSFQSSHPTLESRQSIVRHALDLLKSKSAELAAELTAQMGRPRRYVGAELATAIKRAEFMLSVSSTALADTPGEEEAGFKRLIQRRPVGVVLVIFAWNYPYLILVNSLIPALLAGNAVILKPSPQTPTIAEHIKAIFEQAGLPRDVIQYVHCGRPTDLRPLILSPSVNHVSFTGSTAGGLAVQQIAAARIDLTVGLELGGKDPAYVRPDIDDVAWAAEEIVDGAIFNSGQSCCAIERVYVHADIHDAFVAAARKVLAGYTVGDPNDEATQIGPVISRQAKANIEQQIADAIAAGATDETPPNASFTAAANNTQGNYVAPRLLTNIPANSTAAVVHDETFGPVIPVVRVHSDDEAIALMNDSSYGLTASIWTKDVARGEALCQRLEAGTVFVNRADYPSPDLAWTGWKDSGKGVTMGRWGFESFVKLRSVHVKDYPKK